MKFSVAAIVFSLLVAIIAACVGPSQTALNSTPTIFPGILKAKLVGDTSKKPLEGAAIILGLITGKIDTNGARCILKANLIATVGADGGFEIADIPPGSYVLFYNLSGSADNRWQSIDDLELILDLETREDSSGEVHFHELYSSFCGGGYMTIKKGTRFTRLEDDIWICEQGALTSEIYGLTMDIH